MNASQKLQRTICALALLLAAPVKLSVTTAIFNLDSPPATELDVVGSAEHQASGGINNSGFLKLTDNAGQSCGILFPDLDNGMPFHSFTFECQIKLGDYVGNPPADGFSVNFVRSNDPIISLIASGQNPGRGGRSDGWAGSFDNGGTDDNLPEEGTKTGLAIGFDTWGTGAPPVGGSKIACSGTKRPRWRRYTGVQRTLRTEQNSSFYFRAERKQKYDFRRGTCVHFL